MEIHVVMMITPQAVSLKVLMVMRAPTVMMMMMTMTMTTTTTIMKMAISRLQLRLVKMMHQVQQQK